MYVKYVHSLCVKALVTSTCVQIWQSIVVDTIVSLLKNLQSWFKVSAHFVCTLFESHTKLIAVDLFSVECALIESKLTTSLAHVVGLRNLTRLKTKD